MHAWFCFYLSNVLWAWLNRLFDFDVQDSSKILIGESLCTQASYNTIQYKGRGRYSALGIGRKLQVPSIRPGALPVLLLNRQGQWPRKGRWSHKLIKEEKKLETETTNDEEIVDIVKNIKNKKSLKKSNE
jgi:hypothetical protein